MGIPIDDFKHIREEIKETYKKLFMEAYRLAGGNVSVLALGLGLSRGTVHRYIKENFGKDYRRTLMSEINRRTRGLDIVTDNRNASSFTGIF